MATSDITKITARVSWILGSHGSSFDATISDDRFIQEEIRRAIVETEAEIVRAACESYHPMRTSFLSWSTDLSDGDTLPAHIGQVEAVRIKPYSGSLTYNSGESTSRSNIKHWRTNTNNIFDTIAHDANGSNLSGYFNITNETIRFTGNVAQVKVCSYEPDYATPALQIEDQFDNLLVAGTIPRLNKLGVPQALIMSYGSLYSAGMDAIRSGLTDRPEISVAQAGE
jgi:hypothetical protein